MADEDRDAEAGAERSRSWQRAGRQQPGQLVDAQLQHAAQQPDPQPQHDVARPVAPVNREVTGTISASATLGDLRHPTQLNISASWHSATSRSLPSLPTTDVMQTPARPAPSAPSTSTVGRSSTDQSMFSVRSHFDAHSNPAQQVQVSTAAQVLSKISPPAETVEAAAHELRISQTLVPAPDVQAHQISAFAQEVQVSVPRQVVPAAPLQEVDSSTSAQEVETLPPTAASEVQALPPEDQGEGSVPAQEVHVAPHAHAEDVQPQAEVQTATPAQQLEVQDEEDQALHVKSPADQVQAFEDLPLHDKEPDQDEEENQGDEDQAGGVDAEPEQEVEADDPVNVGGLPSIVDNVANVTVEPPSAGFVAAPGPVDLVAVVADQPQAHLPSADQPQANLPSAVALTVPANVVLTVVPNVQPQATSRPGPSSRTSRSGPSSRPAPPSRPGPSSRPDTSNIQRDPDYVPSPPKRSRKAKTKKFRKRKSPYVESDDESSSSEEEHQFPTRFSPRNKRGYRF